MKILGCALIFVSSLLCSYFYEKNIKKKIDTLEELVDLISLIKNKIEYFSEPINKIFLEYNTKNTFIKNLLESKETAVTYFDQEIQKQVSRFFSEIGNGYKKEQIALCDYNIQLLNNKLTKIKNEYPNKIKIFRSIALFVGISIIILLV